MVDSSKSSPIYFQIKNKKKGLFLFFGKCNLVKLVSVGLLFCFVLFGFFMVPTEDSMGVRIKKPEIVSAWRNVKVQTEESEHSSVGRK